MIANTIKQLCALSILCGAALSITPEGSVKRVMSVVCSVALMCAIIQPLLGLDFSAYALERAKYEQRAQEFLESNGELSDRLNRLVIQSRYEAYIMDKAKELGLPELQVSVSVQWSGDGLWVPWSAEISGSKQAALSALMETELGIPAERQYWSGNE